MLPSFILRKRLQSYYLGVRSTLIASGVSADQVLEMDWWEEMVLPIPSGTDRTPSTLTFCCVPSQHNSGMYICHLQLVRDMT